MPDILSEDDLQVGNAMGETLSRLAFLVGPALAGPEPRIILQIT